MSAHRFAFAALLLTLACVGVREPAERFVYPSTRIVDQVDDYHGTSVADPYRWLEDLEGEGTRAWVAAQNELSSAYIGAIPQRTPIHARLTRLWNYERFGLPRREGGRSFYTRNDGLQNHAVVYVVDSADELPRVLLNPNSFSDDGTTALGAWSASPDGRFFAYGVSESGSDWSVWRVRDVESTRDLEDRLEWVKFSSASWARDSSGFYYSRYEAPPKGEALEAVNSSHRVYFHRLGTPQSEDRLVYERDDGKRWLFGSGVTWDDRYLVIWARPNGARYNGIFVLDRKRKGAQVRELLNDFDAHYDFVGNDGPVFWFRTNLLAPRGRVIAIDTRAPGRANWKTLIPESKHTLRNVRHVGGKLVASYLADAYTRIHVHDTGGRFLREVALPGIGSAGGFFGKPDETETYYSYTSHTRPTTIYRHDLSSGQSWPHREPQVDFQPSEFEARQVFYRSRDGTRVPMFLVHRKGVQLDGRNPTLLRGYGGFNISTTPRFSVSSTVWMEMGGVLALPNLRGGGEYGEDWHQAGMKQNKQNVFDDFIAAAEWLIAEKITSPDRLAISGRSNGGLLVGAAMTQRPDLFAAALPGVGVMDMLRFHRFTIGWAWIPEYGSADDPDEFAALYAYSPLHNLRAGVRYPATLVHTSDHDDRVVPAHSYKFAAALQAVQAPGVPALIRVEVRSGHGAGKPTAKRIDEAADRLAFVAHELEMDVTALGR